jgi:hypothetical protein
MNDRRTSSQRGAIDRRHLIGTLAVLAVVGLGALLRRSPPPLRIQSPAARPAAPPAPPATPDVPTAAPRVENDFHVAEPAMPSFAEQPRQPVRPAADVPPVIPASSGDYNMDVATIIRPALPAMQRCVAEIDPAHPRAAQVWVTISTRGRVSAARLDTDAGAGVDACLLTALQPLAFASPGTEARTFGIPIPAPTR